MANPVLLRELRGRWRRPLTFLILLLYAVILAVLMAVIYAWSVAIQSDFYGGRAAEQLGRRLFSVFFWTQTAIWMVLPTALAATSISGERERGLLEGVLLSPLSAGEIVRGKIAAELWFIGLLLLVPMPVSALCFRLGGLAPGEFALAFLILGTTALSGASLGLATSACHRRSDSALLTSLFIALSLSWPPVLVAFSFDAPYFELAALVCIIYQLIVTASALGIASDAVNNLVPEREIEHAAVCVAAQQAAKKTSSAEDSLRTQIAYQEYSWAARLNFANPVMQREVRARLRRRVEYVPIENGEGEKQFVVSTGPMDWVWAAAIAFSLVSVPALIGGAGGLLAGLWIFFVALVAAAFGALVFTREREQQTLQPLLMSLLSPREVVFGKAGGACVVAALYGVPFLPIIAVGLCTRPLLLAGILIVALSEIWLAAAIGLAFSWICRKTAVAVGGALTSVLLIVLPIAVAPMMRGAQRSGADYDVESLINALAVGLVFFLMGMALLTFLCRCLRPRALQKDGTPRWPRDLSKDI